MQAAGCDVSWSRTRAVIARRRRVARTKLRLIPRPSSGASDGLPPEIEGGDHALEERKHDVDAEAAKKG